MIKHWIISDTHFQHTNVIEYCNRPFSNVEEMGREMIKRWNNVVRKDDIVWHLGDFGFGNKGYITNIVSQLNGRIRLIKGNHCNHNNQWYRDCGFDEVYDRPIIIRDFIVLSHAPQPFICDSRTPYVNFFGHVHDPQMFTTYGPRHFCACVERHNYTPVNLDEVISHFKEKEIE